MTLPSIMLSAAFAFSSSAARPTDDVNPFIGTAGNGHTTPAAWYPSGMVQPGPDSGFGDWAHCSGYVRADPKIYGFSQTHLSGTGVYELMDFLVQPYSGDDPAVRDPAPKGRHSAELPFTKAAGSETARPGYYSVAYAETGIRTEITASARVGMYRFTAGRGGFKLLVDAQWNAAPHRTPVRGGAAAPAPDGRSFSASAAKRMHFSRTAFFAAEFSRPFKSAKRLPRAAGDAVDRWVLDFGLAEGDQLLVKAAISASSAEGARRNLALEPGWDFDGMRRRADDAWNGLLGRVELPGSSAEMRTVFYTALYHAYLQPTLLSDAGERTRYTSFSLWDTFRAAHPLYTVLRPETTADFVESLLHHYREEGGLPVMPYFGSETDIMIGKHAVAVIADAFLKGFEGPDWNLAFEAVTNALTVSHAGLKKEDWAEYARHGYYPFDVVGGEGVSRTMEISYDDWCAAEMAGRLGRREAEMFFRRRSGNWRNVFDPSTGLARGRDSSGAWREPFDPFRFGGGKDWLPYDCTEGNAHQYTWHVMHDPWGLAEAVGGRAALCGRLKGLFTMAHVATAEEPNDCTGRIGEYIQGNEPSHHILYFFPLMGERDFAADMLREVCGRFYSAADDGLCGNDDCGQMSAWYVFSALGFYPFNPCGGEFVLGAPQLPKAVLHLPGGRRFTVTARGLSPANRRVGRIALDSRALGGPTISYGQIMRGGELEFEMLAPGAEE